MPQLPLFSWLGIASFVACMVLFAMGQWTDNDLRSFRRHDVDASAYRFVPGRWRAELYTPEASPLLATLRRRNYQAFALGVLAGVLLAIGGNF